MLELPEDFDSTIIDAAETITAAQATRLIARGSETMPATPMTTAAVPALPRIPLDSELEVVGELGRGGMGQVQLAYQRSLDRQVAIKRLLPGDSDRINLNTLLHEGVVTGKLEHPNVVPVHWLGVDEAGDPVIVMKRVEGVSWKSLIRDPQHETWEAVSAWSNEPLMRHLEIFIEICAAIRFAHARNVIHRDVKPGNVMVGAFGEVYLLDWGIACEPGTAAFAHVDAGAAALPVGTPSYMAPEMLDANGFIDERTDVFLLGASLITAIDKRPKYRGRDVIDVFDQAIACAPAVLPDDLPQELAIICHRATAKAPEDRYQNVAELRHAVTSYLRHRGSIALTERADALLAEMLLAEDRAVEELFTKCRFAYMQALREWGDNAAARAGLRSALEAMIAHHFMQDNLVGARGLIDALEDDKRELLRELRARTEARDADEKKVQSLRDMARDLDPTLAKRARLIVLMAAAATVLLARFVAMPLLGFELASSSWLVSNTLLGLITIAFSGALLVLRHEIVNRAARHIIAMFYIGVGCLAIGRLSAWQAGATPLDGIRYELVLCLGIVAMSALAIDRRMWPAGAAYVVGLCASMLAPASWGITISSLTHFTALASAGGAWHFAARSTS